MVTGVGFLCAGVVLEEKTRIVGLTTASTIWFTAAMGLGIGGGQHSIVTMALIGAMIILWVFPRVEKWIYNMRERRTYEIVCEIGLNKTVEMERLIQDCGVLVKGHKLIKNGDEMICIIDVYGPPENHERVMDRLLAEKEVKEFHY